MWSLFSSKVKTFGVQILCAVLALAMLYVVYLRNKEKNRQLAELEKEKRAAEKQVQVAVSTMNAVGGATAHLAEVIVETDEKKAAVRAEAAVEIKKIKEDADIIRNIGRFGGTTADAWNAYSKLKNPQQKQPVTEREG